MPFSIIFYAVKFDLWNDAGSLYVSVEPIWNLLSSFLILYNFVYFIWLLCSFSLFFFCYNEILVLICFHRKLILRKFFFIELHRIPFCHNLGCCYTCSDIFSSFTWRGVSGVHDQNFDKMLSVLVKMILLVKFLQYLFWLSWQSNLIDFSFLFRFCFPSVNASNSSIIILLPFFFMPWKLTFEGSLYFSVVLYVN